MNPIYRAARTLAVLLALSVAGTSPAAAGPEPGDTAAAARAEKAEKAATYCPRGALVIGNIVIQAGRCYVLYLIRDIRGLFLVFAAPGGKIPPGQLVRLNTPAGAKVKGRIFYWVPVRAVGFNPPIDTVWVGAIRVQQSGPRVVITLTPSGSVISVSFGVR